MTYLSPRDIFTTDIFSYMPVWTHPYLRLMRLDKPIGTWLLLLPCWWSIALSASSVPNLYLMLVFAVGAFIMRGAGCVINDIYDRELDKQVERTRLRPLASGEIKLWQALLFLVVLFILGLGVLLLLNSAAATVGIISLLFVFSYPLMKRITWWPQLFLGITFNWGALMGGCAVTGLISLPMILIYMAGIFWTLGYDTIYAHQDMQHDAQAGIKSTALLFGEHSKKWVSLFYIASLLLFCLSGWAAGLKSIYYWGILLSATYALVQLILWRVEDPESCLKRFKSNRNFGLIILASILLGKML